MRRWGSSSIGEYERGFAESAPLVHLAGAMKSPVLLVAVAAVACSKGEATPVGVSALPSVQGICLERSLRDTGLIEGLKVVQGRISFCVGYDLPVPMRRCLETDRVHWSASNGAGVVALGERRDAVERVSALGSHLLVTRCLESGPSCTSELVDTTTGASEPLDLALDAVRTPAFGLSDGSWVFVGATGEDLVFRRLDLEASATHVGSGPGAWPDKGVAAVLDGERLVVVYGAPVAGDTVVVDTKQRVVVQRVVPPVCP